MMMQGTLALALTLAPPSASAASSSASSVLESLSTVSTNIGTIASDHSISFERHVDHQPATINVSSASLMATMTTVGDSLLQRFEVHLIECACLSIMLASFIYFLYYFISIAQKPKLITKAGSEFGHFVMENFDDILTRPFYPIFFFWGCNFQTALFGYMQGTTSEMPRNEFLRQYLDVSDEQYYLSNVDLNEFYQDSVEPRPSKFQLVKNSTTETGAHTVTGAKNALHYQQNLVNNSQVSTSITLESDMKLTSRHPVVLRPIDVNLRTDSYLHEDLNSSASHTSPSSASITSSMSSMLEDSGIETVRYHYERDSDVGSQKSSSSHTGHHDNQHGTLSSMEAPYTATKQHQLPRQESDVTDTSSCQIEINSSCLIEDCGCMMNIYTQKHHYHEYGQCALDWYKASHKNYHNNQLVALVSAGMTTGSDKIYVTDTVKCLEELGYEVCVFIRRGVGGLTLKSARFFSPTKWKDFEAAVESIKLQRPDSKLVAIGFSFGAIELCRYLSMTGKNSLVDAAMLISCPYNPEVGGLNMRKTFLNRLMDSYLMEYLGRMLYIHPKNRSVLDNSNHQLDFSVLPKLHSLYEFEDNFNRVIQYYPNSDAYAKDSILVDAIENIKVPTLCLSSSDDFMATKSMLPLKQLASHDRMAMILTKHGGHMAFVDGVWPRAPFLGQRILSRYMKALRHSPYLSHHQPTR